MTDLLNSRRLSSDQTAHTPYALRYGLRRATWDGMWVNLTSRSGRERLLLSSPPIGPVDTTFTLRIEATGGRWEREACAGHRDRLRQKERILTSMYIVSLSDRCATTVVFGLSRPHMLMHMMSSFQDAGSLLQRR